MDDGVQTRSRVRGHLNDLPSVESGDPVVHDADVTEGNVHVPNPDLDEHPQQDLEQEGSDSPLPVDGSPAVRRHSGDSVRPPRQLYSHGHGDGSHPHSFARPQAVYGGRGALLRPQVSCEGDQRHSYRGAASQFARDHRNGGSQSGHSFPPVRMRIPTFNGKTKWVTFIRQFEAIAYKCAWSEDEKLAQLLASLSDVAADYAFQLEPEDLENYDVLTTQLERRFKLRETRDTCQQMFYSRMIKSGETPSQFAADLKMLILKAFPTDLSYQMREEMLMKQFFDGLQDEDARYFVKYMKKPCSIDEAVDFLYEYRAYKGKAKDSKKTSLRVVSEETPACEASADEASGVRAVYQRDKGPVVKELECLKSTVGDLTKSINQLVQGLAESKQTKRGGVPTSGGTSRKCFNCGGMGHWSRECPSPRQPSKPASSEEKKAQKVEAAVPVSTQSDMKKQGN